MPAAATMWLVPRISEVYRIVIAMYYREHGVPHFHATYVGETVVVSIQTGERAASDRRDCCSGAHRELACDTTAMRSSRDAPNSGARWCQRQGPLAREAQRSLR